MLSQENFAPRIGNLTKRHLQEEFLITFLAIVVGIYSQLPALTHPYVIVDDVRQHLYWMRQFQDTALFTNDPLTEYAKYYQPWGLIVLYYLFSFVMDPLVLSKILPIPLLAFSSFYLFKLVKHLANRYAGFLASILFMTTFTYVDRISGGLSRSFAFPLLIVFLYYLIKKKYHLSSLVLVLQCLFYPMLFLIGALTWLLMFVKIEGQKIRLDISFSKAAFFMTGILLGIAFLGGKYVLTSQPWIGILVTRSQIINHAEYYEGGQDYVLPTDPLLKAIGKNIRKGLFTRDSMRQNPVVDRVRALGLEDITTFLIVFLLLFGLWKIRGRLPQELFSLFFASALMYKISDFFLFKLFQPRRYLEFSIPLITLILFAVVVGRLMEGIKGVSLKKFFQIAVAAVLLFFNFHLDAKEVFMDMSYRADLYDYLSTLPKETLIAAHPDLANGVPTFARRKVFIQFELSHPFYDRYWQIIKKRTYDFFDAYYAGDPALIYQFCKENQIEYLVVDKNHFTDSYLSGDVYFEPFNAYVKKKYGKEKDFALMRIPESDKLFATDSLFVIHRESLKPK